MLHSLMAFRLLFICFAAGLMMSCISLIEAIGSRVARWYFRREDRRKGVL